MSLHLCMTNHKCQHNLTFNTIKNEADKERYSSLSFVLFLSKKKKMLLMHRIIYETCNENVIAIRMYANWFKQLKNSDFDINDKESSERPATIKKKNELRKDEKQSWKTMENTWINLYYIDFFN